MPELYLIDITMRDGEIPHITDMAVHCPENGPGVHRLIFEPSCQNEDHRIEIYAHLDSVDKETIRIRSKDPIQIIREEILGENEVGNESDRKVNIIACGFVSYAWLHCIFSEEVENNKVRVKYIPVESGSFKNLQGGATSCPSCIRNVRRLHIWCKMHRTLKIFH